MKSDAIQFWEFISTLEGRRRFVEVDASTPDSRAFVDGHYEKAWSCLLIAERMKSPAAAAVVPLCYQVVLSAALLALRREGIAVKPLRWVVDTDTIRAGGLLLEFDAEHSESIEQMLRAYARSFDVGPPPTDDEVESALGTARHAVQRLAVKQPQVGY
jgi:hypothetical protein